MNDWKYATTKQNIIIICDAPLNAKRIVMQEQQEKMISTLMRMVTNTELGQIQH